ncbi:hypothetical protein AeMF1_000700 [Aphanomyces euteiches]|nr:hypothetical protein AeMF1_000700 [Aphanomyces euteiches]KAH9195552.1 hypothetical protein AeNC1_002469 [Aphanomyces euteiches]
MPFMPTFRHSPTTTVYLYGLCGSTSCSADFTNFTSTYPPCAATSATSLRPWIQAYTSNCSTISTSLGNSTCTVANYADYNWAKYQVQLTQQCASALNLTTSSLWYTAIQSISLTNNAVTNAFCNTPDCVSLTTGTTSQLGNCTVQSGENLFNTATNVVNYCNSLKASSTPTPTQATTPTPVATTPTPAGTAATTSVPAATPTPTPTPTATKSSASTFATTFAAGLVAGFLVMLT